MAEQTAGTPDSNAGASSKDRPSTSKDRACPFCNQQFTSSSLGRHLDLYIKEKNPKPADGIHNVEEIKKIRGHITRRQPRNSMSKRESSTPGDTPSASRRSPSSATGFTTRKQSPGSADIAKTPSTLNFPAHGQTRINQPSWEATGVINDIPSLSRNGSAKPNWDAEDDMTRRNADGKRSMSKQMLAKSTFDQKQKMLEALDNARAAELALREVLGSIRAANERNKPTLNSPLDYDPMTLDFPALCLHCLPPPPTLYQTAPIPAPNSWSIEPPDHAQYESLRLHFQNEFHRWRITSMIVNRRNSQESSGGNEYNNSPSHRQTQSHAQEEAISIHVNAAFSHWTNLSPATRSAHWRLELARSVGRKASAITRMKEETTFLAQENAHLRAQVNQLSRLQSPREFRILPPKTIHISPETSASINEMGLAGGGIGFEISEKVEDLEVIISKAISRWKSVVQSSRGMTSQKRLDADSDSMSPHQSQSAHGLPSVPPHGYEDGEGERDVDMEVDDNYTNTMNGPSGRATEAQRGLNAHLSMGLAESPGRYENNHGLASGSNGRNGSNGIMGISNFEQGR